MLRLILNPTSIHNNLVEGGRVLVEALRWQDLSGQVGPRQREYGPDATLVVALEDGTFVPPRRRG